MSGDKVVSILKNSNSADAWTIQEMVDFLPGSEHMDRATKALFLFVDDKEGFNTNYLNSGLKNTDLLALLEIMKQRILNDMAGE